MSALHPTMLEEQNTKVCVCVSCLVGDALKACDVCPFNIGRAVRAIHLHTLDLGDKALEVEAFWATIPNPLWEAYCAYCKGHPLVLLNLS